MRRWRLGVARQSAVLVASRPDGLDLWIGAGQRCVGWRSGDWVDTWLVSGGRVRVVFQVALLGQNPGVYLGQHQSGNKCVRLVRIRGLSLARYRVGDPVWNRGGHHYWDTATRRVGGTAP